MFVEVSLRVSRSETACEGSDAFEAHTGNYLQSSQVVKLIDMKMQQDSFFFRFYLSHKQSFVDIQTNVIDILRLMSARGVAAAKALGLCCLEIGGW